MQLNVMIPMYFLCAAYEYHKYRQTYNISRTKSETLDDSRLVLQLCLLIPLKPGVESRMKM